MSTTANGLILQASYRIIDQHPVIRIYGRLENGESFLIRDRRGVPSFYIADSDARRAQRLGVKSLPTDLHTFAAAPVRKVEVSVPPEAPRVRDRLHGAGIATYEADVRYAVRYLLDRDVKGGVRIEGERMAGRGVSWIYDEPDLSPASVSLLPRVLAFDIETDPAAERLLAISIYGLGRDEVYIVDPERRDMPPNALGFGDEKSVIEHFSRQVRALDVDVLTGWNVIDFDLNVLNQVAQRTGTQLALGREPAPLKIREAQGYFGSGSATIPGRLVLDGIDLLRGAFIRMDEYSLDAVARQVLGEGKTLHGQVDDRADEIMANYANDLDAFALYARTDSRLALEIVDELNLINLSFARSQLTGMTPDRVAASIASFDYLYLNELKKHKLVAPTVRNNDSRVSIAQAGGQVFEPRPGVYENVWVFDFKSLYPSIIRTLNIDPVGFVAVPDDAHIRVGEVGFKREKAILPGMLDDLFPRREQAKRDGDEVASQAIKILMNSFYGVLGTPACRFHNPAIANAITGTGRYLLDWSRSWFEEAGYEVLYGDTDSVFVRSAMDDAEQAVSLGPALAQRMTADLETFIHKRWQVESRLELEFEKLYTQLFLASVRHGSGGARKRYAGLKHGSDGVEFVGMEVVRRDWTELAKQVQRELYRRLFSSAPVEEYLKALVDEVRRGERDEWLVYRKGLRKPAEEYTASTPPHVVAARKSTDPTARIVVYVMTTAGPEPVDALSHPPDLEHYIDKQIRPVAEPVLSALGLEFDQVIGDDRQLGLF
jgi:DNA polymerase-2